jgi:type I restriction enzyme S subunit
VGEEATGSIAYTGLIRLWPGSGALYRGFIKWIVSSELFFSQIKLFQTGSTIQHYGPEHLRKMLIPLPIKSEQKIITDFLDHKTAQIDRLIEKKQVLVEKLNEKRTALITRAVTKGLDENVPMKNSGVEWLGEVPEHWDTVKVRYCTGFVTSGPRGWAKYFSNDGALFIRIANLCRNSISLKLDDVQKVTPPLGAEGERTSTLSGDVLVSITADLGSTAVVPDECENSFISQHIAIVRPEQKRILPKWLAFSCFAASGKVQLLCAGYGGTKIQLGLNDIKEVVVALPESLDEQSSIIKSIGWRPGNRCFTL